MFSVYLSLGTKSINLWKLGLGVRIISLGTFKVADIVDISSQFFSWVLWNKENIRVCDNYLYVISDVGSQSAKLYVIWKHRRGQNIFRSIHLFYCVCEFGVQSIHLCTYNSQPISNYLTLSKTNQLLSSTLTVHRMATIYNGFATRALLNTFNKYSIQWQHIKYKYGPNHGGVEIVFRILHNSWPCLHFHHQE